MISSQEMERFVEEFGDHAYSFAYSLCGNELEARELVQESFVKVFDRAERYDASQPLESWYMTVMRNIYLDGRRRWERRNGVPLDAPLAGEGEDGTLTVADAMADPREEAVLDRLERDERAALVRRAIAALAPDLRALLTMVDIEGLGYEQAAKVLDCPLNTVRSRLFRARAALRARLVRLEVAA